MDSARVELAVYCYPFVASKCPLRCKTVGLPPSSPPDGLGKTRTCSRLRIGQVHCQLCYQTISLKQESNLQPSAYRAETFGAPLTMRKLYLIELLRHHKDIRRSRSQKIFNNNLEKTYSYENLIGYSLLLWSLQTFKLYSSEEI